MRLSDIMSAMHLGTYAEAALVLFMAAFLAIGVQVFRRRNASDWERARHLPLDAELQQSPAEPPPRRAASGEPALTHQDP